LGEEGIVEQPQIMVIANKLIIHIFIRLPFNSNVKGEPRRQA